jgi:hypothetical protein
MTTTHPLPDYPSRDDGPAALADLIAARSLRAPHRAPKPASRTGSRRRWA